MQLRVNLGRFKPPTTNRRDLPSPASPHLRAAQVVGGRIFDGVESFPPEHWRALEHFRPRVLVGPAAELHSLAEIMGHRGVELPSVDRAVFVITRLGEAPASDVLRVILWQTFAVPIYEMFLGPENRVLAAECEAHDGWHPLPKVEFWTNDGQLLVNGLGLRALRTGFRGDIVETPCGCGRPGPRILNLREHFADRMIAARSRFQLAASA